MFKTTKAKRKRVIPYAHEYSKSTQNAFTLDSYVFAIISCFSIYS